jgi:hypothetical protein
VARRRRAISAVIDELQVRAAVPWRSNSGHGPAGFPNPSSSDASVFEGRIRSGERDRTFQPWGCPGLPGFGEPGLGPFALVWARFCSARCGWVDQIRRVRDTVGDMALFAALRRSWLRTIVRGRRSDRVGQAQPAGGVPLIGQTLLQSQSGSAAGRRGALAGGRSSVNTVPSLPGDTPSSRAQIGARQLAGAPRLEGHLPIPRRPRLRFPR